MSDIQLWQKMSDDIKKGTSKSETPKKNIGEIIKENTDYWRNLYFKEKEKNEELNQIKCAIKILQNNGLDDEHYIVIANKNLKNTSYKNLLDDYISKDKIKERIKTIKEIYEREMKPYQTEYGLNVSLLSKKEKDDLIGKRNGLLIQIASFESLLEEGNDG